jgi:hypothetical protein
LLDCPAIDLSHLAGIGEDNTAFGSTCNGASVFDGMMLLMMWKL